MLSVLIVSIIILCLSMYYMMYNLGNRKYLIGLPVFIISFCSVMYCVDFYSEASTRKRNDRLVSAIKNKEDVMIMSHNDLITIDSISSDYTLIFSKRKVYYANDVKFLNEKCED